MNLPEHAAKQLVLRPAGIPVLESVECFSAEEAGEAFLAIGPCMVKALVPAGRRGKAGGVRRADSPEEAAAAAGAILGMVIDGHRAGSVLVEKRAAVSREFYVAVAPDATSRAPMIIFSTEGGVDIEEVVARDPAAIRRLPIDVATEFDAAAASQIFSGLPSLGEAEPRLADVIARLCQTFRRRDAELIEINPLALLADGGIVALDCKFVLDPAAAFRQPELAAAAAPERLSDLERRGAGAGLKYIELEGSVGVLANGAGLTMTTMDMVRHFGGSPANFLEIGGDAYTRAEAALELVLSRPEIRSLIINFCGAFARTDVMAEGVVRAWEKLRPRTPVFFSIHGTGEEEAVRLVRERLGVEPFELMEDAVKAAVEAAR